MAAAAAVTRTTTTANATLASAGQEGLDALGVPQIELAFFDDKEAVHEAPTELPWHRVVKARSAGFSQTREEGLPGGRTGRNEDHLARGDCRRGS